VVVGPGRSEILILGGLQHTSVCRLGSQALNNPNLGPPVPGAPTALKLDAATSVTAPAASQPASGARETTQKAVSTTEMCWVAPNLSAPSAMDVKPWQSLNASAPRFEGPQILFGARKTPEVLAGRAKPQCSPQGFVLEGSDRPACRALSVSRTDWPVRGPMTTGLQHTLAATRASALRCCRLSRRSTF